MRDGAMDEITIFLADNHSLVRDGLRYLLSTQSNLVVIGDAANGREAVQYVTELQPDVVIMDVTMPELNGIEATYKIRQVCHATQIIILSMHAGLDFVIRALHAGAKGYLLKDTAGEEIISAVQAVYGGHRYLSQSILEVMVKNYIHQNDVFVVQSPLNRLSSREREVLQMVVEGKSSSEIADFLSLSPRTIDTYRSRLMRKLDIDDIPALVKFAIQHGLTPLE